MSPPPAVPMVIDTDPGIDDAIAILAAIADPGIDLKGLTTAFGNVPVERATRNALALAAFAGRGDLAVAEGAAYPLARDPAPHPDFVHGADGFGGAVLPEPAAGPDPRDAAAFLAETAAAHRGRLVVVAVGPLTNLAHTLDAHPAIARDVARVVVMGGSLRHAGNVTPYAEANVWQDPEAAERVLSAAWPVTMVGLDVTETVRLYAEDLRGLRDAAPRTHAFLSTAFGFYAGFHARTRGFHGCYLHDPVAALAAVDPGLLETIDVPVAVDRAGEALGRTRPAGDGRAPIRVALAANAPAIRRRLLGTLGNGPLP